MCSTLLSVWLDRDGVNEIERHSLTETKLVFSLEGPLLNVLFLTCLDFS